MGVTRFDIKNRKMAWEGKAFDEVGPYEFIGGTLHYAIDPKDPDSQLITDIGLVPVVEDGLVHFSSDVQLLKPLNPPTSGSIFFDVVNRGNRTVMMFNDVAQVQPSDEEPDVGNGFLMRQGMTVVFCGWQTDVPDGRIALYVPEALDTKGKPLVGQTYQQFDVLQDTHELLLSDRQHKPLPAADLNDHSAILLQRDWPDGPSTVIPRDQWLFARWRNGIPAPDPNYICLPSGFELGKVYEVIYNTVGSPVIGLGFLAMRDCTNFFKHGTAEEGNPSAGTIEHAYAFGASQSGRFVREFLYWGFNIDENGRQVYDGLMPHTGSSRLGEFNMRFGQPSSNHLRNVGNVQPLTYSEVTDPVNEDSGSLLRRLHSKGKVPKIIATNSAVEYWWSGAALSHIDPTGKEDVPPPANVRIYHLASTKHGPGGLPLTDAPLEGFKQQHWSNTLDYRPVMRAALYNLHRWVVDGVEPPDSKMPRLSDGTGVPRESLERVFRAIPSMGFPVALPIRRRLEFGSEMTRGIPQYPANEGEPYATIVSAVNSDGNEIGGVCLPDILVPLATHTGWTMRHPDIGGTGHFMPLEGAVVPFALTQSVGQAKGDPRPSIQERYPSEEDYRSKIAEAAQELVQLEYILEEDVERILEGARVRWATFANEG